jgi:3-oxoisoapionate kinase
MSRLRLTFYGDDFTGSTDALEQLALAGLRAALFIAPPTAKQLARFKNLQALGVAGMTRSLNPAAMERELAPAFRKLKALGAPHVHYKVCSTFDSSPAVGSIGRAIDVGARIFKAPFVPLLVAAPPLGRHCVFGNLFARFGIGSDGAIHRLDRHPSVSRHPVTPMREADLRLHLARQTRKQIGLFDILMLSLSPAKARAALKKILSDGARIVLFDALYPEHLKRIGELLDTCAKHERPLFSVGSSGIEMALGAHWNRRRAFPPAHPVRQLLVASGSCSRVTSGQIQHAVKNGFKEVALDTTALASGNSPGKVVHEAAATIRRHLKTGRSVIVHTCRSESDPRIAATAGVFKRRGLAAAAAKVAGAELFGVALGDVLRATLASTPVPRLCIAGGDTSSYAARTLGIEALEMIAPLTPGAPLCRAHAPGSPVDGLEVVFKGGQVGAENYFELIRSGSKKAN